MSNVIWKFPVSTTGSGRFELRLPKNAKVLDVQLQGNLPQMWVQLNPDEKRFVRTKFEVIVTGEQFEIGDFSYIGTFQLYGGTIVGHIYKTGEIDE